MSIITKDQLKSGLTRANSYVDDVAATVGEAIDSLITRVETLETEFAALNDADDIEY